MPKSDRKLRILIADDDFDTQKILSDFLAHHGFEPIVAIHGKHALKLADSFTPDLALVDVRMPGPSGMSLAAQLKELQPDMEVIIITAYGTVEAAAEAIRQGVYHYLAKPLNMPRLLSTVNEALGNEQVAVESGEYEVGGEGLAGVSTGAPIDEGEWGIQLSPRQQDVLRLLSNGLSNREIANELGLSEKTVGNYVSSVLQVLQVRNRTTAAVRARELGLL